MWDLCRNVSKNCTLVSFHEKSRRNVTLTRRPANGDVNGDGKDDGPTTTCYKTTGSQSIIGSATNSATLTEGTTTSISATVTIKASPESVGMDVAFTTSYAWKTEWSYGKSSTFTKTMTQNFIPDTVNEAWYYHMEGTSAGIAMMYFPGDPLTTIPAHYFEIPLEITGDLPTVVETDRDTTGIVMDNRPMTHDEWKAKCPYDPPSADPDLKNSSPSSSPGYIASGTTLRSGWSVQATLTRLVMQSDGNLVMYRNRDGAAIWSTHTSGHSGAYAVMQTDGNFVVYDATSHPLWSTHTAGNSGAWANMQDDGNFVIYKGSTALWNSGTATTAK
ncbi:hypothetical protein [Streptomyces sp. 1222.5]|uniref:hypothetical protein n=1 Tax=Streptomyces sp. 1222.5 TaxID=1881026 RepID=UPI003EB77EED